MATTLASLSQQVRERADMQNSQFVSAEEVNLYINNSAWELYDIVTSRFEDQFIYLDPLTGLPPVYSVADTALNYFTLPTNFYKLRGVDRQQDANMDTWFTLAKWNFAERNNFISRGLRSYWGSSTAKYRVLGSNVWILPQSDASGTYRLWYIPKMIEMTTLQNLDPSIEMWSEYIVVDAAIKCLIKEESDTSMLMAIKGQLLARIEAMSANRDAGAPETIANVRNNGWGSWSNYGGDPWG